jgi:hypothetical protein
MTRNFTLENQKMSISSKGSWKDSTSGKASQAILECGFGIQAWNGKSDEEYGS